MHTTDDAVPPDAAGPVARGRSHPSIADVAQLAGVSSQTVSRVSTGAENVRPATRRRVLDAMAQLGYSPNHAARCATAPSARSG
jgi:DNA-binding LacI/PurR family transcriptional regulator